jgi:hypothetical protein
MRKYFALAMVGLLALTVAFAAVGCGQKAEEPAQTTTETTPPAETMSSDSMMADTTAMTDTTMAH